MATVKFFVATSYHPGWTITDQAGKPVPLEGAVITFDVYDPGTVPDGQSIPWIRKTNIGGQGITVISDGSRQSSGKRIPAIIRIDFDAQETIDKGGVYPWEMKGVFNPEDDERRIDKGTLVLLGSLQDP